MFAKADGVNTTYTALMSPEAATIGKYGTYPVSCYTGSIDIKLPLYELKTRKLDIPIYLQYDASGFMPGKESGKIGHDWTLFAGGVITRSVNGAPDEFMADLNDTEDFGMHGHLYGIRNICKFDNDSVLHLKQIDGNQDRETAPDLFSFHFGNHSGQFMIDHDGNPQVIGEGCYKVDITNLACQYKNAITEESSILITTGDGTRYTFGGSIDALELSLLPKKDDSSDAKFSYPNGVITAFYLVKIETPDGEVVNFNYANFAVNSTTGYKDGTNILKNLYYADGLFNAYGPANTTNVSNGIATSASSSLIKVAYLESIVSPVGTVYFNYKEREKKFMKGPAYWNTYVPLRLDNIEVKSPDGTHVKGMKLYQSFVAAKEESKTLAYTCQRMFLDSLQIGNEKYRFDYNTRTSLPCPETRGIDLQGFYNGNDTNSTLLALSYNDIDDVDFSHRQPSKTYASLAMLKKITYPTGGYSEFTFENHDYGTVLRKYKGYWHPWHFTESGKVGGLRIKEIKNSTGEVRTYEYTMPDPEDEEQSISSGVYNNIKQYAIYCTFEHIGYGITTVYISQAHGIHSCATYSESEIGYSRVIERIGDGKGSVVYEYSTYDTNPDLPVLDGDDTYWYPDGITSEEKKVVNMMLAYTGNRLERGKLKKRSEYNESGTLVRESSYAYNEDSNKTAKAIYSGGIRFYITGTNYGVANSVAYYYYPNELTKEVVNEYNGSANLSRTTVYTYTDSYRLPASITTYNSDSTTHSTKYTYPADYTTSLYKVMVDSFVVAPVVTEKQYYNGTLEKTLTNSYAKYHDAFFALSDKSEAIGSNSAYTTLTVHGYDKRGNVLSQTELGKPTESYVWGYNYQYPLAVVEGTIPTSALSDANRKSIAAVSKPTTTQKSLIDGLHTSLTDARVTTCYYQPLVGMTYRKDPNSLCYYYTYDDYARLVDVSVGQEGQSVKSFDYSVVSSSLPLAVVFTDNTTSYEQGTYTFAVNVSGGSGAYEYAWNLKNSSGTLVTSGSSSTLSYDFTATGSYTLTCQVTDTVTGESQTISRSFTITVKLYAVQFSNVSTTTDWYDGNVTTTATIQCQGTTSVTFMMEYEVPATLSETCCTCQIGNTSFTVTGKGQKEFTVTLSGGSNAVEICLKSIIASANVDLWISSVNTAGSTTGSNNYLNLFY